MGLELASFQASVRSSSMRIWALSDLHLSLDGDKPMDVFGDHWQNHHQQMAEAWDKVVADDDIVLTPGDFSWAKNTAHAVADFAWLAERPGSKILVKGNHDYWWPKTKTKLHEVLPEKTYALKKNACIVNGVGFFGARGGDFAPLTRYGDKRSQEDIDKALEKEQRELELSLNDLKQHEQNQATTLRICLFHYPPIPAGRKQSRFSSIIEESGAKFCIYGHLHGSESQAARIEAVINNVDYRCTSCDLLGFEPSLIFDTES